VDKTSTNPSPILSESLPTYIEEKEDKLGKVVVLQDLLSYLIKSYKAVFTFLSEDLDRKTAYHLVNFS
jgi:hypothetical protein